MLTLLTMLTTTQNEAGKRAMFSRGGECPACGRATLFADALAAPDADALLTCASDRCDFMCLESELDAKREKYEAMRAEEQA